MRKITTIAAKDFKSFFSSPIAYIVIAGFLVMMGWMFFFNLNHYFEQNFKFQSLHSGKAVGISEGITQPLFGNMNVVLLFLTPFITMRLFSEEKKQQTIVLLMTSPVRMVDVILGKFFSALWFILVMLACTTAYPIALAMTANPDLGPILSSYLGTVLLVSCYISLGVFFSAWTENQIIAGALTFAGGLFFWLISWASQTSGPVFSDIFNYLSLINHFGNFAKGVINTSDVIFYVSFVFIGLYLTFRTLNAFRWR